MFLHFVSKRKSFLFWNLKQTQVLSNIFKNQHYLLVFYKTLFLDCFVCGLGRCNCHYTYDNFQNAGLFYTYTYVNCIFLQKTNEKYKNEERILQLRKDEVTFQYCPYEAKPSPFFTVKIWKKFYRYLSNYFRTIAMKIMVHWHLHGVNANLKKEQKTHLAWIGANK